MYKILTFSEINLNLPPSIRFKRRNILLVGFTPGPNNPKEIDSFLWPLVEEFKKLERGVETWNAATEQYFNLHAYITIVTADMPGREKLMCLKGNRAYSYCNYCLCRGIHNKAIYCPFSPPEDAPDAVTLDPKKVEKNGYPWPSYDRRKLPLRTDQDFRKNAAYIASDLGHTAAQKKTGIAGQAILHHLSSIDFPRSFPPDSMHLFYENVIPAMVRHYRGVFFKSQPETSMDESENDCESDGEEADGQADGQDEDETITTEKSKKRKRQVTKAKNSKRAKTDAATTTKFRKTLDPWNVEPDQWLRIGEDQEASARNFPSSFGRAPRNFASHCHEFSGEEWKQQATLFLPIYLQDVLPEEHYDQFCKLMYAMNMATDITLTDNDIKEVEDTIFKFSEYYETTFYARKWDRLSACLPVFHQLIHVADALRWIGPMHVYAQWAMERMCGMLTKTAKSRVKANRNMELTLQMTEQKHVLGFVLHPEDWNPVKVADNHPHLDDLDLDADEEQAARDVAVEDPDGNLLLSEVFAKRMQLSRPAPPRAALKNGEANYIFEQKIICRALEQVERQRFKIYTEGLAKKANLKHFESMLLPDMVDIWKRSRFRDNHDNIKGDFKVTSAAWRSSNNTRNASMVVYEPVQVEGPRSARENPAFGEVQFFFSVWLPAVLPDSAILQPKAPDGEPAGGAGTALHELAYIKEIAVEGDGWLLYRKKGCGAFKVIAANRIKRALGLMQNGKEEYLVTKYSSLLTEYDSDEEE
jgi:hypothetical protein